MSVAFVVLCEPAEHVIGCVDGNVSHETISEMATDFAGPRTDFHEEVLRAWFDDFSDSAGYSGCNVVAETGTDVEFTSAVCEFFVVRSACVGCRRVVHE